MIHVKEEDDVGWHEQMCQMLSVTRFEFVLFLSFNKNSFGSQRVNCLLSEAGQSSYNVFGNPPPSQVAEIVSLSFT